MPSSQITFRGQLIFSVGQPKQVQPTNTFINSVNLKLLIGQPLSFVNWDLVLSLIIFAEVVYLTNHLISLGNMDWRGINTSDTSSN